LVLRHCRSLSIAGTFAQVYPEIRLTKVCLKNLD
jgi:hypothetical protein